jgi:hypothetical protein
MLVDRSEPVIGPDRRWSGNVEACFGVAPDELDPETQQSLARREETSWPIAYFVAAGSEQLVMRPTETMILLLADQ